MPAWGAGSRAPGAAVRAGPEGPVDAGGGGVPNGEVATRSGDGRVRGGGALSARDRRVRGDGALSGGDRRVRGGGALSAGDRWVQGEGALGAGDHGVRGEGALAAGDGGMRGDEGAVGAGNGGVRAEPAGGQEAGVAAHLDEPEGALVDGRPRLDGLVRWRVAPRTAGIALGALLLVGGAVALRSAGQPTGEPVAVEEPAVTAPATDHPDAQPDPTPGQEVTVWVHVVGEVASPGVVAMPAGSRVADAVSAAGGALPGADLAALNLAAVVQDGAQIRVPAPGEEPVSAEDAGGGAVTGGGATGAADGAVDLNTAGAAELQTLPGIGPVLAERIVTWREANGPFASVDALLDVSGIGPAVLGQLRDLVRV